MKPDAANIPPLGDVPADVFRQQLHEVADWIADYRENISKLRISPSDQPGAIRAKLPAEPPEFGEKWETILEDFKQVVLPGIVHWAHPQFAGYFGSTTTAPGIL